MITSISDGNRTRIIMIITPREIALFRFCVNPVHHHTHHPHATGIQSDAGDEQ